MYVRHGARLTNLLWHERVSIVVLIALALATELVEPYIAHLELFSVVYVGVFSTALSIFLVFRFNESYERWWEARSIWGQLVNSSRSFARQVLTLLDPADAEREGRALVLGHVAFVHALRIRLRATSPAQEREETVRELERLLPDEASELGNSQNIPNTINLRQGARLTRLLTGSTGATVRLARLDDTLAVLCDVQGACERIKRTTFPDSVTLITRVLVWGLVVLLLLATVGPEGRGGPVATFAVCVMSMGYLWIDALARDLKNPFDNEPNDTPMTALSITIERDLREMLGDAELPPPAEPVDGVLM